MAAMRALVALTLLLSAVSFAQQQPPAEARARPPQVVIFEADDVLGAVDGPAEEQLIVKRPARFESLVKVRTDFHEKVLRSVHEM